MLRAVIEHELMPAMLTAKDGPDAARRASGAASQISGLVLLRYVLGVEPLASASHDVVVTLIGPTIQRHITP
jgi:hypothetical protein